METNALLELYNNGKLAPALAEGKYEVVLKSHEAVQKEDGKTFIKFVFKDVNSGRNITETDSKKASELCFRISENSFTERTKKSL